MSRKDIKDIRISFDFIQYTYIIGIIGREKNKNTKLEFLRRDT